MYTTESLLFVEASIPWMLWVPLTDELNSSANCKKLRPREPIKTFGNPQKLVGMYSLRLQEKKWIITLAA